MENFSESDKEFLDMTQGERKNFELKDALEDPCMSELNGARIDWKDEAEGMSKEAFEAAKPKITGKILAGPAYGIDNTGYKDRLDFPQSADESAIPKTTGQMFAENSIIFGTVGLVNNVRKFRKKPVVIEAIQYTAYSIQDCYDFIDSRVGNFPEVGRGLDPSDGKFKITTLEGVMIADVGDWIIKGVNGEFYPCKPDIFKKTYDQVNEDIKLPKVPSNDEMIYESYHMLLELTEKYGDPININQPADDSDELLRRKTEWEEMVKNSSLEDLQKGVEELNDDIKELSRLNANFPVELVSDGYHTFKELYEFRMLYNAAVFNEWAKTSDKKYTAYIKIKDEYIKAYISNYAVHKSWNHHDGEPCFGGGWFIVSAMLPDGLISNHYKAEYWEYFKVPEVEKALFEFDGHTSEDVQKRLTGFLLS